MSNIKIFLGGYSLLNTLQQTTAITLSKCSISSSGSTNQTNKPITHSNLANRAVETVPEFLKSKSIKFCQGWNNYNVYNCSKAGDNIFMNENGLLQCYLSFVYNICLSN